MHRPREPLDALRSARFARIEQAAAQLAAVSDEKLDRLALRRGRTRFHLPDERAHRFCGELPRELGREFVADRLLVFSDLCGIDDVAARRNQLDAKTVFLDPPSELREIDEHAHARLVFLGAAVQPRLGLAALQLAVAKSVEAVELPRALEVHHVLAQPAKALERDAFDLGINLANHRVLSSQWTVSFLS